MLEEIAGRTNFKNPAWWWQHPLVPIDVRQLGGAKFHNVYAYSLNKAGMSTPNTPAMIDMQAQNVADAFAVDKKPGEAAVVVNGCHWLCAFAGGLLKSRGVTGLEYYVFDYFNAQGWDHIHAGIIRDAIALATSKLSLAAKEAISETIRTTETARGEPRLCNWVKNGHSKIHSIINWFLHDALYHLWRVLPEEELVMITMLWIHMVHIRGGSPNEDDLEISEVARDNYELLKEVNYGMQTAKPNDVKLLRAEFSVREFMTLCTSSELVVDCGMKGIMLSLRKLMSNGSAMKGAMKRSVVWILGLCCSPHAALMLCRFVYEKMMVQIRWVSGAPMSLASMNDGLVPATNEHICLLGKSKLCAATDVCHGKMQLLKDAVSQFPNLAGSAAAIATWCETANVSTYARLQPAYWHSGRSMCTAAHDLGNATRQSGRSEVTPMQGHFIMVHSENGGEEVMSV